MGGREPYSYTATTIGINKTETVSFHRVELNFVFEKGEARPVPLMVECREMTPIRPPMFKVDSDWQVIRCSSDILPTVLLGGDQAINHPRDVDDSAIPHHLRGHPGTQWKR